jgi:hypothetical protein
MPFVILLAASGLTLSAVAIYYSVIGLTAIFAAAFWPIVIMGTTLELSKLVAASWLKANWTRIPRLMKTYMMISVIVLMLITSMGIFGFLSKAHLDQSVPTGDVADKVALIDEKIKTQRDNIDAARNALKQLDAQVDQTLGRSTDERGAERAVQIRRQQTAERNRLQKEISASQTVIAKLNEERAPIAKELRKVEAEVGPIKYIAKLIYGDNPDANLLEKAVTWIIITIIFVFDPLAVLMLLASQMTYQWYKEEKSQKEDNNAATDSNNDFLDGDDKRDDTGTSGSTSDVANDNGDGKSSQVNYQVLDDVSDEELEFPKANSNPSLWPFPSSIGQRPVTGADTAPEKFGLDKKAEELESPEEVDPVEQVGIDQWNKMIEEAEREAQKEKEESAKKKFKQDHPDASIKQIKKLHDDGVIDQLPWESEVDPVEEAKKWVEEQAEAQEDSKKKMTYIIKDQGQQITKTKE